MEADEAPNKHEGFGNTGEGDFLEEVIFKLHSQALELGERVLQVEATACAKPVDLGRESPGNVFWMS